MPKGLDEERARVVIYLPVGRQGERQAYSTIIKFLESQKQAALNITGFTYNTIFPAPYIGTWFSTRKKKFVLDNIATIFIDLDKPLSNIQQSQALEAELRTLKDFCLDTYKNAGCPQQALWMVVQQIQRFN